MKHLYRFRSGWVMALGAVCFCGLWACAQSGGTVTDGNGSTAEGVDSDGDGVSDADEIAAGMDPNNADSDADGWPDGVDADSPRLDPEVAAELSAVGQMFQVLLPGSSESGSPLNNSLERFISSKDDSEPFMLKASVARSLSTSFANAEKACGGYTSVEIDKDDSYIQIVTTNPNNGSATLKFRVAGTPYCKNTQADGTFKHPLAPISWQLGTQNLIIIFDKSLRDVYQIFYTDSTNQVRFMDTLSRIPGVGNDAFKQHIYAELVVPGGSANDPLGNRGALVTLGAAGNTRTIDPKMFGFQHDVPLVAMLMGLRPNCAKTTNSFAGMILSALPPAAGSALQPPRIIQAIPRLPSGGPSVNGCPAFFEGSGASVGWRLPQSIIDLSFDPRPYFNSATPPAITPVFMSAPTSMPQPDYMK